MARVDVEEKSGDGARLWCTTKRRHQFAHKLGAAAMQGWLMVLVWFLVGFVLDNMSTLVVRLCGKERRCLAFFWRRDLWGWGVLTTGQRCWASSRGLGFHWQLFSMAPKNQVEVCCRIVKSKAINLIEILIGELFQLKFILCLGLFGHNSNDSLIMCLVRVRLVKWYYCWK